MSQITSSLLAKIAPGTNAPLRDRFLPFLNEACPRYGITNELRVAAFLATICFESQYFQKTKEGHARVGTKARAYQDKYWDTNFMGRGLIQTTHLRNYRSFSKSMYNAGVTNDPEMFVKNPELLEEPRWAVESACHFWKENNLNPLADKGKFFAIQGITNKGNPAKEALDYPDREKLFNTALRFMPDDFNLTSVSVPADDEPTVSSLSASEPEKTDPPIVEQAPTTGDVVLTAPDKDGATATATKTTILGIAVPPMILAAIETVKGLVKDGYVDAKEIANTVIQLILDNQKYVFMLIGIFILLLIVKKLVKQITFWLSMLTHAIPSWNNVTVEKK